MRWSFSILLHFLHHDLQLAVNPVKRSKHFKERKKVVKDVEDNHTTIASKDEVNATTMYLVTVQDHLPDSISEFRKESVNMMKFQNPDIQIFNGSRGFDQTCKAFLKKHDIFFVKPLNRCYWWKWATNWIVPGLHSFLWLHGVSGEGLPEGNVGHICSFLRLFEHCKGRKCVSIEDDMIFTQEEMDSLKEFVNTHDPVSDGKITKLGPRAWGYSGNELNFYSHGESIVDRARHDGIDANFDCWMGGRSLYDTTFHKHVANRTWGQLRTGNHGGGNESVIASYSHLWSADEINLAVHGHPAKSQVAGQWWAILIFWACVFLLWSQGIRLTAYVKRKYYGTLVKEKSSAVKRVRFSEFSPSH